MDPNHQNHGQAVPQEPRREEVEPQQQNDGRRRRSSLERYRPGGGGGNNGNAGNGGTDGGKRLPAEPGQYEGDERRHNRGGRGGGGGGRGGGRGGRGERGGDHGEIGQLMGQLSIGEGDLRHRLNQRSRDVQPPQQQQQQQQQQQEPSSNRENHRRVQGRGVGGTVGNYHDRAPKKRNTENFNPNHAQPDLRIVVADPTLQRFDRHMWSNDVVVVSGIFGRSDDLSLYDKLLKELEAAGGDGDKLWQSWHGDSHLIADDKKNWKNNCPTFGFVIEKIRDYFQMDVKATRLNWYRDSSEWKPFHHDAAAVKPDKARTQNFTVAVSFGMEREVAFEHAKTRTVIALPQSNGTIYTFGKDVNIQWRHGILQMPPEKFCDKGRLSIIAWGWNEQSDI